MTDTPTPLDLAPLLALADDWDGLAATAVVNYNRALIEYRIDISHVIELGRAHRLRSCAHELRMSLVNLAHPDTDLAAAPPTEQPQQSPGYPSAMDRIRHA